MKKSLITLLVLALVGPTMAATQIDVAGGQEVMTITVTVTDDDVVRGLAVLVEQADGDAGDMAIALDGGAFDVDAGAFNTFVDYAFSAGAGYTAVGQGHPIAMVGTAGEIVPAAGVQDFAVSAGYLDEDGDATLGEGLGAGVYEITINMAGTADTAFDVSLDTLRGGIVGDNLEVTDNTMQVVVTPGTQVCLGDFNGDGAISGADVNGFIATFGKVLGDPDYNPLGDFNGDDAVSGADVNGFIAVFGSICGE